MCISNNCFHVNCCHHGEKDTNPLHHLWAGEGLLQQTLDPDASNAELQFKTQQTDRACSH